MSDLAELDMHPVGVSKLLLNPSSIALIDREQTYCAQLNGIKWRVEPETGNVFGEVNPVAGQLLQARVNDSRADFRMETDSGGNACLYRRVIGAEIPVVELVDL